MLPLLLSANILNSNKHLSNSKQDNYVVCALDPALKDGVCRPGDQDQFLSAIIETLVVNRAFDKVEPMIQFVSSPEQDHVVHNIIQRIQDYINEKQFGMAELMIQCNPPDKQNDAVCLLIDGLISNEHLKEARKCIEAWKDPSIRNHYSSLIESPAIRFIKKFIKF